MTDDRKPRIPRRDYAGRAVTPATESLIRPPIVGGVVGECDSDDARVAEVSTDGVVSVEVDPDYTPVQDIVAKLTAIVGDLSDEAREQMADVIGGHEKRGKVRKANEILRTVAHGVDRDLPEWVRHIDERIDAASARSDAAHELAAKADGRWKWPMRIASGLAALSVGAGAWVLTATRASGYEARTTEVYRHQVDRNTDAIQALRDSVSEIRGELKSRLPFRTVPVQGPRNDPSKDNEP